MTPIMHKVVKSFCIVFGLALRQPAFAGIELPYPSGVERLMREQTENATLRIPVSPWSQNSKIQHEKRSGTATITTLQMRATAITPQQVATPIRKAMLDADFKIVLDCFSTECGGFDYRINTPIQSPPKMYINLRNFVSITGINGSDKIINVLISRIGERVYIQERRIDPATDTPAETTMMVPLPSSTSVQNIATTFATAGTISLEGLDFNSGSTTLGEGPFSILSELADYMRQNPQSQIVLVGHSDAIGGLESNIEISKQRAEAVRQRLISKYGIPKSRITAQGIAYLSPRSSNQTEEGRERNRRVEAVILQ